jgi:hypothetical protein
VTTAPRRSRFRPFLPVALFALLLPGLAPAQSGEECTIGVASGRATADGRPLLWKNRDTGSWTSNNTVRLIEGEGRPFLALVVGNDVAWAGVNDAGFAIVNAQSDDLTGPKNDGPGNGTFLRRALGECADIAEFRALLERTEAGGRMTHTSYGVIDAKGGAAIFETGHYDHREYDAANADETPDGWIVRANFAFSGDGVRGGGHERFCRARDLWHHADADGGLDHRMILRVHARDLADPQGVPFRLPVAQGDETLPPFSIETRTTINRHTTAACNVFRGVRPGEDPRLTTMWSILGEPICSIAVPAWIAAGAPPKELAGPKSSAIRDAALDLKGLLYTSLFRDGSARRYLDTRPVLMVLADLYPVEDEVFRRAEEALVAARAGGPGALAQAEAALAAAALAGVERAAARQRVIAPLRVGVYRAATGDAAREGEVVATLAAVPGVRALGVDAADVAAEVLDGLEAIVFVGDGRELVRDLGRSGHKKVREFAKAGHGVFLLGEGALPVQEPAGCKRVQDALAAYARGLGGAAPAAVLAELDADDAATRQKAFAALVAGQPLQAARAAVRLLRDDEATLRTAAAEHLASVGYGAGLRLLLAAQAVEKEDACKEAFTAAIAALRGKRSDEQPFFLQWRAEPAAPRAALVPGTPLRVDVGAAGEGTGPAGTGYHVFRVDVPAGSERLTVAVHGIAGAQNLDLFVRHGTFPFRGGADVTAAANTEKRAETVTIDNPAAGPWFVGVESWSPRSATTPEWASGAVAAPEPFAGVSYQVVAHAPPLAHAGCAEGFYKDLFMDSGVRLTTRFDLPAADALGWSMEYVAVANRGANDEDVAIQDRILGGNAQDENGVLLYPDGAPRFRCIYFNGGSATNHGKSLSERAKDNFRTFYRNGGSVTGSCAGAFLTSLALESTEPKAEYLHLWPAATCKTGLLKTLTGHLVPADSPLLRYADFGGDGYIADVWHNGGCFTDPTSPALWAAGSEVLLRYDYRGRPMHEKVSCWARKPGADEGRVVAIGSHPEGVSWGEQLALQQAILRYAVDGLGRPRVKAGLASGELRRMDDNGKVGHERLGDLQYHHFTIDVPAGARRLVVRGEAMRPGQAIGVSARADQFAWRGGEGTVAGGRELVVDAPRAGRWFVAVKGLATVGVTKRPWGWEYGERGELLDGVGYTIRAEVVR